MLLGFLEQDGLLYTTRFLKEPAFAESFARNWSVCGPASLLSMDAAARSDQDQETVDRLALEYKVLRPDGTLATNGTEMTDLLTDAVFAESTFRLSHLLARHNRPVYRYSFKQIMSRDFLKYKNHQLANTNKIFVQ